MCDGHVIVPRFDEHNCPKRVSHAHVVMQCNNLLNHVTERRMTADFDTDDDGGYRGQIP